MRDHNENYNLGQREWCDLVVGVGNDDLHTSQDQVLFVVKAVTCKDRNKNEFAEILKRALEISLEC